MAVPTRYQVVPYTLGDLISLVRYLFLQQNTETTGEVDIEVEIVFWINKAYMLLENYDWTWSKKKTTLTTTASTSSLQLPIMARDKKPIDKMYIQAYPALKEEVFQKYAGDISDRTGSGIPRRFMYDEKYTTARSYSTGTVSATAGAYTITGVSTVWLSNLFCGSTITIGSDTYTVARVSSDTSLTTTTAIVTIASGATYTSATTYPLIQIDLDPIPADAYSIITWYYQKMIPLINNSDEPLLPLSDREVLADGAYALYQWFHDKNYLSMAGISPSAKNKDKDAFLTSPSTIQKFFNQFVSKMLADDKKMTGSYRPKLVFKRGY